MAKGKMNQNRNSGSHMNNTGHQNQKRNNPNALSNDPQNYKETLQTYYRYMQQLPPQREWMKYKFGLRIRDIFDAKKDVKILSVGSGAGDVDKDFLNEIVKCGKERLGQRGYSVQYIVVEPNSANVESFRKFVSEEPNYERVQFKWHTCTFDKFCDGFRQKTSESNTFDFVHFCRCFYHFDSVKAFDFTYDRLLARNGIMCGLGENENAFWPRMMHFLQKHNIEHEGFDGDQPVSQSYFLPGWLQLARDRNWRYESYVQGYNFNITPIFDPSSKDGNYLIDFAFHQKQARKTIKKNVIEDFIRMLDERKFERVYVQNNMQVKRVYYPCELGVIMITKE